MPFLEKYKYLFLYSSHKKPGVQPENVLHPGFL